jgi:predicted nucleotidyltransferase
VTTARTRELRDVAERIVDALAPVVEEVVLTGSVSRGVADELSDIELILVTDTRLELAECFEQLRELGLRDLDTWGAQGSEPARVFGYYDDVPIETIWWSRDFAEATIAALAAGERSGVAEALVSAVALRTNGLLAWWQRRLSIYPDALAAARIEEAARAWGGFHPTGLLTLARPGERLALIEHLHADAVRVLRIVYALNRVWEPTSKRLAARVEALAVKPERLAERIGEALTEADPVRAMLVLSRLQADVVGLAPAGPNVERARRWLPEVIAVLHRAAASQQS